MLKTNGTMKVRNSAFDESGSGVVYLYQRTGETASLDEPIGVTLDRDWEVKEKDEEGAGAGAGAGALSKVASRARHQYFDPYTAEKLPLDGDYDGAALFQGPALRHGCTSDVKECWRETSLSVRRFSGEHALLRRELADLNLVSSTSLSHQPAKKFKVQAKRKATKRRVTSTATGFGVNQHLRGTDMERILRETRDKNEREDMGSR
ncbi:hypothetical protein B484DRAFT_411311 [Ochromonadaceae sp. CCMP2298]|nr:hypothetical protein B484DRAFT_411311 [Ochromonadaceae sp. CCMP2298]